MPCYYINPLNLTVLSSGQCFSLWLRLCISKQETIIQLAYTQFILHLVLFISKRCLKMGGKNIYDPFLLQFPYYYLFLFLMLLFQIKVRIISFNIQKTIKNSDYYVGKMAKTICC